MWLRNLLSICLLSFHCGRIILNGIAFNTLNEKSILTPTDLGGLIVSTVWSIVWIIMLCLFIIGPRCNCSSKPMFTDLMNCFPSYRASNGLLVTEFFWMVLSCIPDMVAAILLMVNFHTALWVVIAHGMVATPAFFGIFSAISVIFLTTYTRCYHGIFGKFPKYLFPHHAQNLPPNIFTDEIPDSAPISVCAG